MVTLFYLTSAIAIGSAMMAISRSDAVQALLYLVVSYIAAAVVMLILGAPFAAALELIVYAGAIVVMFVFALMIMDIGPSAARQEAIGLTRARFAVPALLGAALVTELSVLRVTSGAVPIGTDISAKAVGVALWGPYLLAVEFASMLLLGALIGALHLGRKLVDDAAPEAKEAP